MVKTLRNRLILSHILPLLIILPLMGIGLVYVLETQVYLPALSNELENDARFLAQLTQTDPAIWINPSTAQAFVDLYSTRNQARMMLLDSGGQLLASSDPLDQKRLGQQPDDMEALPQPAQTISRQVHYSSRLEAQIIDVFVPVPGEDRQILGYVRISFPFASITDEIFQLRFLIFVLLAFGLLIGSIVGIILAVSLSRPVREVTQTISALANNSQMKLTTVQGPEEIQQLSHSVNDLVTRLRTLEQARRQLLANLVHEIGRPLGAIRSAITALSRGAEKDPELFHDLLNGMDKETEHLQRLLNDLASLHDQVLGSLELDRQPIEIKTWLPEVLRTLQAAAEEKGVQWKFIAADDSPVIYADPTRLAQIFGNLVSNAVKFTPAGGSVTVTVTSKPEQVGISIQDTGPGISAEEQAMIFQPFFRGKQGKRFPQGMGLGLSIARDLAEAHGGHLTVESVPDQGSRFTVWLPAGQK